MPPFQTRSSRTRSKTLRQSKKAPPGLSSRPELASMGRAPKRQRLDLATHNVERGSQLSDFVAAGSDASDEQLEDSLASTENRFPTDAEEDEDTSAVQSLERDNATSPLAKDDAALEQSRQAAFAPGLEIPSSEGLKRAPAKSISSAIAEILDHPGPANRQHDAPILLGSKTLAKRQHEDQAKTDAQKAAKKLRLEMKQRGHEVIPEKGEDPEHDAAEKALLRTATRGVVLLFNAVSKAQKKRQEALQASGKEKAAQISKSGFFTELRTQTQAAKAGTTEPSAALDKRAARKGRVQTAARGQVEADDSPAGWDVLNPGFAGLQGGTRTRMKDWDKAAGAGMASAGIASEALSGSESESEAEGLSAW